MMAAAARRRSRAALPATALASWSAGGAALRS